MRQIFLLASLLLAIPAFSSWEDVRLGEISYGGTGCPAGTATVALSADLGSIGMVFDSYKAVAGGSTGRGFDRKTCNIAIPIQVPPGYSIAISEMDFKGFNFLPLGSYSTLSVEYFFPSLVGTPMKKRFDGKLEEPYAIKDVLSGTSLTWSPCGQQTILRANTSIMVNTNEKQEESSSEVYKIGKDKGWLFNLKWKRC